MLLTVKLLLFLRVNGIYTSGNAVAVSVSRLTQESNSITLWKDCVFKSQFVFVFFVCFFFFFFFCFFLLLFIFNLYFIYLFYFFFSSFIYLFFFFFFFLFYFIFFFVGGWGLISFDFYVFFFRFIFISFQFHCLKNRFMIRHEFKKLEIQGKLGLNVTHCVNFNAF